MNLGQLASLLFLGLIVVVGFISLSDSQKASRLRSQFAIWRGFSDSSVSPIKPAATIAPDTHQYSTDSHWYDSLPRTASAGSAPGSSRPSSSNSSSDSASYSSPAKGSGNSVTGTYVIRDGDTLGKIAEKFKVERKDLLEANRLSEGQPIYIGETLLIPGIEGQGALGDTKPKTEAGGNSHTVAKGDTLMTLSREYNTSVDSIKSANGLRSDVINLGQNLTIPSQKLVTTETTMQVADTTPQKSNNQEKTYQYDNKLLKTDETYGFYTVQKGDNLYAIARDFFTNMAEIQRLNRLGNSTILHPGDDIVVPTSKYIEYHNSYHEDGNDGPRNISIDPSEDSELVYFVSPIRRSDEEVKAEIVVEGVKTTSMQTGQVNEREIQIITLVFPNGSSNVSSDAKEAEDATDDESSDPAANTRSE